MENTRITYMYRDGSNYKTSHEIILAGKMTYADIKPFLDEGLWFVPHQVGMRDLQQDMIGGAHTEDDHPFHELEEGDFEETDDEPTEIFDAEDLKKAFSTITEWDQTW